MTLVRTETLSVGGAERTVKIYIESRNNCRVSVGRRAINIRLSRFMGREAMTREISRMKAWAENMILRNPGRFMPAAQKEYRDGETLKIGGEEYFLKISFRNSNRCSARISGNTIALSVPAGLPEKEMKKHISHLISRAVARHRLPVLQEKVRALNDRHFRMPLNKVSFRHNKSNWGSCSPRGNISISTRILFAPEEVLDYVCVHELAHLKERNHSNRFWKLVSGAVPDYEKHRAWLKENRDKCVF